jgi:hypothetical protein
MAPAEALDKYGVGDFETYFSFFCKIMGILKGHIGKIRNRQLLIVSCDNVERAESYYDNGDNYADGQ